jgi:hypothetical protein
MRKKYIFCIKGRYNRFGKKDIFQYEIGIYLGKETSLGNKK